MLFNELLNKKVAIFGLGNEGQTFLKLWEKRTGGIKLTALEDNYQERTLPQFVTYKTLKETSLSDFDIIIKSPGISAYREDILSAKTLGVQFTSLVDLWFSENKDLRIIAITGTKGKSTTSSLTTHLLNSMGVSAALAGNFGIPLFENGEAADKTKTWVVELSSYQDFEIKTAPKFATLLNLYPEHTNWHGTVERYYLDKLNLFDKQGADSVAIINGSDVNTTKYLSHFKNPLKFNTEDSIHIKDGYFFDGEKRLFPTNTSPLLGEHNLINCCAALTNIKALGLETNDTKDGLKSFKSLPHRLENIGAIDGITFIDDSISTIPEAALAALKAFPNKAVTIILGGDTRAQNWRFFAEALKNIPPFAAVTIPDNGDDIAQAIRDYGPKDIQLKQTTNLEDAVKIAKEITPQGGIILLSPAAPSYGHFKNFQERGDKFKEFAKL